MLTAADTVTETRRQGLDVSYDRVEKTYGTGTAVSGITLHVPAGKCLALLGPNGAGKTTLFKLLLGLIRPTAGSIAIGGFAPGDTAIKASIGFLPESIAFDRAATGEQTLKYFARLKGVPVAACDPLLAEVGLAEAARRRVSTYSKGMRQRLGLAQALLGSPRLMLLDEPTSGLDPELRRQFYGAITRLRDAGITIILASHALGEVEAIADQFAIIRQGRLLAHGPLAELKARARLPVRLRISVGDGEAPRIAKRIGDQLTVTRVNGCHIEFECDEGSKVAALRTITAFRPSIGDVEIASPTLELLYEHFTRQGGEA